MLVGGQNNTAQPYLRLVDLSLSFGPYKALKSLSIDIKEGEFFSLLGPSGCGKTTTLRLIAGFETPSSGSIHLDGRDITELPANLRDTNTVFQSYALFPHMTVEENVAYPLRMRGVPKSEIASRVTDALGKVSLTSFKSRLPHEMSGGQRQRAALARALVGRPKILLLDEPLGALDLRLREQMQHVLVDLQRSLGITFIYVTHDQGEALAMSDRIAVMSEGLVQQIGTPVDIYYKPNSSFVADFIGKSNRITADDIQGEQPTLRYGAIDLPRSISKSGQPPRAIALRYEALELQPDGPCDVSIDAKIDRVTFLGSIVEVVLESNGQKLVSHTPSRKGLAMKVGDTVRIGIMYSDVVCLHD